jgi:hypothetical protein
MQGMLHDGDFDRKSPANKVGRQNLIRWSNCNQFTIGQQSQAIRKHGRLVQVMQRRHGDQFAIVS